MTQSIESVPPGPRTSLGPPSKLLLWSEWRSTLEFGMAVATSPALLTAPRGDGHPVWVLPGFLTSDRSTLVLRTYLSALGYQSHAWEMGRNLGGVVAMRERLRRRLSEISSSTGRTVSIVGWSLGGLYARDLAAAMPELLRYVITLGSPFRDMGASNANALYESLSGERFSDMPHIDRNALGGDLHVPTTAVHSKTDGVVNWRSCVLDENSRAENVEVYGSHLGLGVNPSVLWLVANRLAQAERTFRPFDPVGPFMLAYPR
jgi:pimeloyl-ACP methyl ester carboxylesterase